MGGLFFKKSIGSVVAVSLLIIVSVISVSIFQSWFQTYSSDIFMDIENQGVIGNSISIEGIIGDKLYIKSEINQSLNIFKIEDDFGNIVCELNYIKNSSRPYLLSHIDFEERNSTHFFDKSGNGNNGQIIVYDSLKNITQVNTPFGLGGFFYQDGWNTLRIQNLDGLNFPQIKGTVEFLLRFDKTGSGTNIGYIFDSYYQPNQYLFRVFNTSSLLLYDLRFFNNSMGTLYDSYIIPKYGNFDLITISFDKIIGNVSFYVNDILVSNRDITYLNWTPTSELVRFGFRANSGFEGVLDEIRIYNTSLSKLEIENTYNFNVDNGKIDLVKGMNKIYTFGCNLEKGKRYLIIAFSNNSKLEEKILVR